ncbi:unnamed protein product [Alopecurus aequalis]
MALQSPPALPAGDHEQDDTQRQLQSLLDVDDRDVTKQATAYFQSISLGAAPGDEEEFWSYCDDQQLTELNRRLALYRIKDHLLLTTGKEVDVAALEEQYPLHVLHGQGYFQHLEASLLWYYHPEHHKIAGLDDYQRLVLRNDGDYRDWDSYSLTYHTYEGDLDYVRFYNEMSTEIKWIEDKIGLDDKQRRKYNSRACLQAMKIESGFHNLFRHSVLGGYMDYMDILQFNFDTRKDFDRIYLESWKRVAKQNIRIMDYYDALGEIYEQNMFPSRMGQMKLELEKMPPTFHGWMKKKYDTFVGCINEKVSEEECHILITGSMKKTFPERKTYLDYARKKMEVTERIGLIPKKSHIQAKRTPSELIGIITHTSKSN